MAIDTIRTWQIGDVEITRIVEVNNWEDDITMLLPDATPETVLAYPWLQPHFATPEGKMIISFQCFVMRTPERQIMLDTCIGADRQREFDVFTNMQTDFLDDLAHAGFDPNRIDTVLCTLDFPGELVFASGRVGVSVDGRRSLFILGGLFAGIENQVAVVGHAAPEQAGEADADIDWELSLMRAARVARSLRRAGYDRAIEVQGRSGSRFGGPAPVSSDEPRATLARRIEIIVQNESGDGE